MYKIGIVGDGYTAADLLRLLAGHDEVEAVCLLSTENVGRRVDALYPQLIGFTDLVCEESRPENLIGRCDAVFLDLPHGLSAVMVHKLLPAGMTWGQISDLKARRSMKNIMIKFMKLLNCCRKLSMVCRNCIGKK